MTNDLAHQVAQTRIDKPLKKVQISAKVRKAISYIIWEGNKRALAAERAGLSDSALYQAMRLPKVKRLMAEEFKALREGAPFQAYRNILTLGDDAKSEDVKLRANQWVAGVDGLSPVTKVSGSVKVTHGFEDYSYGQTVEGDTE